MKSEEGKPIQNFWQGFAEWNDPGLLHTHAYPCHYMERENRLPRLRQIIGDQEFPDDTAGLDILSMALGSEATRWSNSFKDVSLPPNDLVSFGAIPDYVFLVFGGEDNPEIYLVPCSVLTSEATRFLAEVRERIGVQSAEEIDRQSDEILQEFFDRIIDHHDTSNSMRCHP
jgi:hypothetical protein